MNEKKKLALLEKIIKSTDLESLKDLIIYNTDTGYDLFGEYTITKKNNKYIVEKDKTDMFEVFYNLKLAIVWVTMYKRNILTDANRIQDLDMLLEGSMVSYEQHKRMYENSKNDEQRTLYFVKLQEDRVRKHAIIEELNSYVLNAKTWQLSRFKQATK